MNYWTNWASKTCYWGIHSVTGGDLGHRGQIPGRLESLRPTAGGLHTVYRDVYLYIPQMYISLTGLHPDQPEQWTGWVLSIAKACLFVGLLRIHTQPCWTGEQATAAAPPLPGYQVQQSPRNYLLLSSLYISSNANSSSLCHSSLISMRLYAGTKSWGGICATVCLLRIRSIFCICSSSFSSLSLPFKYTAGIT